MDMVIDASVALAWCFKDEITDDLIAILRQLQNGAAAVPVLWPIEVANVLALAERRRRISAAESAQLVDLLETLDINVDAEAPTLAFGRILDLARAERLTAYDASYLELAMRLGVPLATKDRALGEAARRLGVAVVAEN